MSVLACAAALSAPSVAQAQAKDAEATSLADKAIQEDYLGTRFDAAVKKLKKAIKLSSCGRAKVSKKSIACCLAQTPTENLVIGKLCAPLTAKACAKKGGTSLGTGTSCLPTNPCVPPASPSGAFLDGLQF